MTALGSREVIPMRITRIAAALALGVAALLPLAASAASAVEPVDLVNVTQVMVNRLGGVSVVGTLSCAGTAAQVFEGTYQTMDQDEQWVTVPFTSDDKLIILTNPDNYVVSQPSGRKAMIQASHASSRAAVCFSTETAFPGGPSIPAPVNGAYAWRTDQFGYDPNPYVPLFDYASNGKFKTGSLNVTGHSEGLWLTVGHEGSWSSYGSADAFYMPYNTVLRAVAAR
jgi:hypothetical protein